MLYGFGDHDDLTYALRHVWVCCVHACLKTPLEGPITAMYC
jgi:hypothetical protein